MSVCWHTTDVPCPDKVTVENLDTALRTMDPVLKFRPATGKKCIVNCPPDSPPQFAEGGRVVKQRKKIEAVLQMCYNYKIRSILFSLYSVSCIKIQLLHSAVCRTERVAYGHATTVSCLSRKASFRVYAPGIFMGADHRCRGDICRRPVLPHFDFSYTP